MFRRATIKTIKGYLTSTGYIRDGFKTAFIHGYNNRMRRLGVESGTAGGLRPAQKENLDGLRKRFFIDGERSLLIEAPTGVGKARIALEFVRKFWRRRGRCSVLVVVPRRVLAYNPWRKKMGGMCYHKQASPPFPALPCQPPSSPAGLLAV
jgi:superfamily II DNA or RNA helicase